jgi:hypothetical protein
VNRSVLRPRPETAPAFQARNPRCAEKGRRLCSLHPPLGVGPVPAKGFRNIPLEQIPTLPESIPHIRQVKEAHRGRSGLCVHPLHVACSSV